MGQSHNSNQQSAEGAKYSLRYTGEFKRSLRRSKKRGFNESCLNEVIKILVSGEQLPQKYLKHELKGQYKGHLECHVKDDWLLIWKENEDIKELTFTRLGCHSELYDKNRR